MAGTGWLDAKYVLRNQPQNIDHVLGILGIEGYQSGEELSARCPLHSDRRPSFSINLGTGLWICHAGCGAGNLAGLVAQVAGIRPAKAERWLKGVELGDRPDDDESDNQEAWYDEDLNFRHLIDPPEFALKERGISPGAAADLGIRWRKNAAELGGYDGSRWRPGVTSLGGWILPIRHPDTRILLGWQTKAIGVAGNDTLTTNGTRKSLTLFGIDIFRPDDPVILVESPLDVAVLRTAGFPALASFGASVSRRQRKLLADRASQIVLALDNDRAGRESHDKLVAAPEFAGKELFRFNYAHAPDVKDIGEMNDDQIRKGLRAAKRILR
jgi:hypothetical protein